MDDLEKYIKANSKNWDDKKAPPGIWDKIEIPLDNPQGQSSSNTWKYILGAFLAGIVVMSIILFYQPYQNAPQEEPLQFAEIDSFSETEQYFQSAIYASYKELSKIHHDPDLERDLAELDAEEAKLREEYKNAQEEYKEYILRSLIDVQRTKLNLLQSILDQVSKTENYADNVL